LMSGQSARLLAGLPLEEFRTLSAELQSPQHMLPSLWRKPQWFAWLAYFPLLLFGKRDWNAPRVRLLAMLGVILAALGVATIGIEAVRDLRLTLFQPFRMATLARGLALVAASGRVLELWKRGDLFGKLRAGLIVAGLSGDWSFVVAVSCESIAALVERFTKRTQLAEAAFATALAAGLLFLTRHDTEQGERALIFGLLLVLGWAGIARWGRPSWNRRRLVLAFAAAWCVPIAAFVVPPLMGVDSGRGIVEALGRRCRFWAVPLDDVEKLAVWCRDHTPEEAVFIGPPGPKSFRLFSLRSLDFNRAGSPYHAEGLADWAERFKDHVGFHGSNAEFAAAYLSNRHGLEAAYGHKSERELVELARRRNADHVLATANLNVTGLLIPLRTEGRYTVYRVSPEGLALGRGETRR